MSKYYKAEDVEIAIADTLQFESEVGRPYKVFLDSAKDMLKNLQAIEVSDDVIGQGSGDIDWQAVTSTGQEIYAKGYEDGKKSVEVSKDCISRIPSIGTIATEEEYGLFGCRFRTVVKPPSVVPTVRKNRQVERAEGEWLHKRMPHDSYHITGQCSICKERSRINNYCPWCGAKMKGAEE